MRYWQRKVTKRERERERSLPYQLRDVHIACLIGEIYDLLALGGSLLGSARDDGHFFIILESGALPLDLALHSLEIGIAILQVSPLQKAGK